MSGTKLSRGQKVVVKAADRKSGIPGMSVLGLGLVNVSLALALSLAKDLGIETAGLVNIPVDDCMLSSFQSIICSLR